MALAVTAVMLLTAAIWVGSGWRALTNPDTYKRTLSADTTLYPDLSTAIVGALANRIPAPSDSTAVTFKDIEAVLNASDRQAIAAQIIGTDWLHTQAEKSVNLLFRWLDNDATVMEMHYDLADVAARLRGSAGDGLVSNMLGRLPACTNAQALELRASRQGTSTAPPLCLPTVLQRPTIRQVLATAVADFAATLDTLKPSFHDTLTELLRANGSASPENSLVSLHLTLNIGQRLVTTGYLLALGWLALLVMVGIRSAQAFAITLGRISLIAALIAFVAAWLAPAVVGPRLRESVTALVNAPALQPVAARLVQDTQEALFGHFMRALGGQSLVLGVAGLVLLGVAALARQRARRATVQPASI